MAVRGKTTSAATSKKTAPAPEKKKTAPAAIEKKTNLPATTSPKSNAVSSDIASAFDGMGTGFENVTAADLLIPRLTILQGLSPQVTQGEPEYDPDARVGMIYDVGLQEGFEGEVHFIPVHYTKQYLEWAPRASGKGLVKIHDDKSILDDCEKDDKNRRMVLANGNYVAETAQIYGMNITADFRKSFIPMTSTQLKKARRLMTLATSERIQRPDGTEFCPPLFYRTYLLSTVPESNNEGNWMGWKIERSLALDELPNWQALMVEIKSFRDSLTKGDLRGDMEAMADEVRQQTRHDENGRM